MLWFELYSIWTIRDILKKQAVAEGQDSVALVVNDMNSILKNMVLQTIGFYSDEEMNDIALQLSQVQGADIGEQRRQLNLKFTQRADEVMMTDRVYKLDMRIYAMMMPGDGSPICNYVYSPAEMETVGAALARDRMKNPYVINWAGIMKNSEQYRYKQQEYVITVGKQMEIPGFRGQAPVIYLSVAEESLRQRLYPNEKKVMHKRFLVDENFHILSTNYPEYLDTDLGQYLDPGYLTGDEGQHTGVESSFGKSILVYKRLSSCPWMIVDIKPYSQVTEKINEVNQNMVLVNLVLVLFFLTIVGLFVRRITEPLRQLQKQMMEFLPTDEVMQQEPPPRAGKEVSQIYECYSGMTKNISELLKENQNIQEQKRKTELSALQAQIKPHFLFNTLMSIRCAIVNGHSEKAADMTLALSAFLRSTIIKKEEIIPLRAEVEILKTYIALQNMRSYQQIEFSVQIKDGLEDYGVPKLLLQPLIENAIVHGFASREKGTIRLEARVEEGKAVLELRDNGKGFLINPLEQNTDDENHFGVYSVENRLHLYYGMNCGMEYRNENGTVVTIRLPVYREG